MSKKITLLTILFSVFALNLVFFLPVLAQMDMNGEEIIHEINMGPMMADKMLHAWISLAAVIVIFALALKFMVGGKLARPIMLIGLGALADAMIGLFPSHQGHMENMWIGSLLFSLAVVIGIIWMAKIFGAFQRKL